MAFGGLAGTLAGMKEDALEAAKLGGGVVLGVSLAHAVNKTLSEMDWAKDSKLARYGIPLAPFALGLYLFSAHRGQYPALAGANGLGMMAYAVGAIAKKALIDAKQGKVAEYVALGAVDNYESNILAGLGQMDYSINRYLSPSLNGYSRYPGAPTFVENLQGAPTQFQTLQGAPTSIESLNGLSATLM